MVCLYPGGYYTLGAPERKHRPSGVSSAEKRTGKITYHPLLHAEGKPMHTKRVWFLLMLLIAVGAATALGACGGSASSSSSASSADVEFVSPADFSVGDYAGKPLVVNYFGSWCGPCNAEAPDLSTFSKAQSSTAAFVGVAVNDTESDVVDFMSEFGLSYPIVLDDNSLSAANGVNGVPTTIFYDASGQEVDRIVGAASLDQLNTSFAKTQ